MSRNEVATIGQLFHCFFADTKDVDATLAATV